MSLNREIDEAICEFANASDQLAMARVRLGEARALETDCINRVNKAQKRVDELVAGIKKQAPRDTDWHRATNMKPEVLA